jgi:hypothetical protein
VNKLVQTTILKGAVCRGEQKEAGEENRRRKDLIKGRSKEKEVWEKGE